MRPLFVRLVDSDALSPEQLNRLRRLSLNSVRSDRLEFIDSFITLFECYRHLHHGLNPSEKQKIRTVLSTQPDLHKLQQLVRDYRDHKRRYVWNRKATQLLDKASFWEAQPAFSGVRTVWQGMRPYAYYASEDLRYIHHRVLPKIMCYCRDALEECDELLSTLTNNQSNRRVRTDLAVFKEYLVALNDTAKQERLHITQAMLVRLELAAKEKDLMYDDVMFDVTDRLKDTDLTTHIGARPYSTPRRNLRPAEFHYFHHAIHQHTNQAVQRRFHKLPWMQKKEETQDDQQERPYAYDIRTRRWSTARHLHLATAHVSVPRSAWGPRWLFCGRNARYQAFHDITRLLQVRYAAKRAGETEKRVQSVLLDDVVTDGTSVVLHRDFLTIRKEHARIGRLAHSLTWGIHSKARGALSAYRHELLQHAEQVIRAQQAVLTKAQAVLSNHLDDDAWLDQLLLLADQLQEAVTLFPKDHAVVLTANTEVNALRTRIATEKINRFMQALAHENMVTYSVYNSKGQLLYRLPDADLVGRLFESFVRYLPPAQAAAAKHIQRVMEGRYQKQGNLPAYTALVEAAETLVPDASASILDPLFRRFIAPSVMNTATAGYALLQAYDNEQPSTHSRQSERLRQVEGEEKASLFSVWQAVFPNNQNLNATSDIMVADKSLSVEDFCLRSARLAAEKPRFAQWVNDHYVTTYAGADENVWPMVSVMPLPLGIRYAHQRLAHLLKTQSLDSVLHSRCLQEMQFALVKDQDAQQTLMEYIETVTLTEAHLEQIDVLVDRFADTARRNMWQHRRESYVVGRITAVVIGQDVEASEDLTAYLQAHSADVLTTNAARSRLMTVLRDSRLDGWSDAQHAVLDAIDNTELRAIYFTRLLRRVLLDPEFEAQHSQHLPDENDVGGCFELINAPEFRTVCAEAIDYLKQQGHIASPTALERLDTYLHHSFAAALELEDLVNALDELFLTFKNQHHAALLAKEVVSLIDTGHHDEALDRIRKLRCTYDYSTVCGDDEGKQQQEHTKAAMLSIFEAITARLHLPVTDEKALRPQHARPFVALMDCLDATEPLLWKLDHDDALGSIVTTLKKEIFSVGSGETDVIGSLPVFLEAIQRGVLTLSEQDRIDIKWRLLRIKQQGHFASLTKEDTQASLLSVLQQYIQGRASTKAIAVMETHREQMADVLQAPAAAPVPFTREEAQDDIFIPFTADTEEGQQIVDDLQKNTNTYEHAEAVMRSVFTTGTDQTKKERVSRDLLSYLRRAYSITFLNKSNETEWLRTKAGIQLNRLSYLADKLQLSSDYAVFFLARSNQVVSDHLAALANSLKAIKNGQQQELPQLNRLMMLCIKFNFIDDEVHQLLITYLSNKLLPYVNQNPAAVSRPLRKALPSLLNLLQGQATHTDEKTLRDYEQYYRNPRRTSVGQTDKVRFMSLPNIPTNTTTQLHRRGRRASFNL